jgi:hypothetical protein
MAHIQLPGGLPGIVVPPGVQPGHGEATPRIGGDLAEGTEHITRGEARDDCGTCFLSE